MRQKALWVIALTLLSIVTGCTDALIGSWVAQSKDSEGQMFKEMQFKSDGSYSAVSVQSGEDVLSAGKYAFDGFTLTLKSPGKAARSFRATYIMGGQLDLKEEGKSERMRKQ